ncbi:PKD domain-containing protein [Myxococcaceae bacterium JPH2]|nr:PKD domain-containing protein [Myxococcaceae bacterium JPH2]
MHPRSVHPWLVAALVVGGLVATGCGDNNKPPQPANSAPRLTGPTAPSDEFASGERVALSLTATDQEGDTLTYAWTQEPAAPAGTFSSTTEAGPTWSAPSVTQDTSFVLAVSVSDGKGGTVEGSVKVLVHAAPIVNRPPRITDGPRGSVTSVAGPAPVVLGVTASDEDGDALSYAWTQAPATPAGSFTDTHVPAPAWSAPAVTTAQRFTLKVVVSDARGGSTQGVVDVEVTPPVAGNTSPTLSQAPVASAATVDEGKAVTLSAAATDGDGDVLTYFWTQVSPASPTGTFANMFGDHVTWTAPLVRSTTTYTLRVSVTDGRGGVTQGDVTVSVRDLNRPPTVAPAITAPDSLVAGDTATLDIAATDPDGDTLTYAWTQTAPASQGHFVAGTSGASAKWFSPDLSTETSFTFSVSVTDGQSAPVERTVIVPVRVPTYADVQRVWTQNCMGCHDTQSTNGLVLAAGSSHTNLVGITARNPNCNTLARVSAGDPNNSVLIRKMSGTTCGDRMAKNNPTLFDTQPGDLVRVRSWILAGAKGP